MGPVELDRPLDAEALERIERRLHGKLRARRISEAFIARHGEDALQQGLAEYARAVERGTEIANPGGWVVRIAYRRAIDELRREVHEENGDAVDAGAIGTGPGSPTEEEALGRLEAEQVRRAVPTLSLEQRQALSLCFFEELTTREAASALGCSEPTFRRRRDAALAVLRERFGIAPEPGDQQAIEVGLAAWLSLSGARVVPVRGPLDQVVAAAESLRGGVVTATERGRELLTRFLSSGGGDVSAAAGSSLGKAGGACAGALAACALSGVVGPGVGGVDLIGGGEGARPERRAPQQATAPERPAAPAPPPASPSPESEVGETALQGSTSPRPARASARAQRTRRARQAATSQFGIESAAGDAQSSGSTAPAPAPEPSSSGSGEGASSPEPEPTPTEAAEEQFGLP